MCAKVATQNASTKTMPAHSFVMPAQTECQQTESKQNRMFALWQRQYRQDIDEFNIDSVEANYWVVYTHRTI